MILVIGGAFSGRRAFAEENFPDRDILDGTEEKVREALRNKTLETLTEEFSNADSAVVIMDELGCGITPLDASDRLFRDLYGALGISLAKEAESVYRLFSGIGSRIK